MHQDDPYARPPSVQEELELQSLQPHRAEESGDLDQSHADRAELVQKMSHVGPGYMKPTPKDPAPRQNKEDTCTTSSGPSASQESTCQLADPLTDSSPLWSRVSPEGSGHSSLNPQHH